MTFMRIRLELARSPEFPEGSGRHGYSLVLPLTAEEFLDRDAFARHSDLCSVHRFWEGAADEVGRVERRGKGRFALSYRLGEADDEPIHRLGEHRFRVGEYLSVREPDGQIHTFRIVEISPALSLAAGEGAPGGVAPR